MLLSGDEKCLDKLQREFSRYGVGEATRSGQMFLEIIPEGISKLKGIREAMKVEGVENYRLVTVGDNMNDKEMIDGADYGFVMENASEELLKGAVYIGTNNNNSPISYVIEFLEREFSTVINKSIIEDKVLN